MNVEIGYLKPSGQVILRQIDLHTKESTSQVMDVDQIRNKNLSLLTYNLDEDYSAFQKIIEEESKFYPIAPGNSFSISEETIESMDPDSAIAAFKKINTRWILNNNIKTVEQVYGLITYLKDLWVNDRNSFFEELWFILKTNLATEELNIIFHDLKEPTEKQAEKGQKPSLCYSYVMGNKTPQIFDATAKEQAIMKDYEKDFNDFFSITELDLSKGYLVATAKVDLSPILIMAKLSSLNQLQRSVLIALFSGLQSA